VAVRRERRLQPRVQVHHRLPLAEPRAQPGVGVGRGAFVERPAEVEGRGGASPDASPPRW
jgi:hypothetical protein